MNKSEIFKALSDETRLRLMRLLLSSGKALCVCELTDALKIPQYQISKHLTVLKNSGLIQSEKKGRWNYYALIQDNLANNALFDFLRLFLDESHYRKDWRALKDRLAIREKERCVVGSVATE